MTWVDQFASQQEQGRLVVKLDVVERIGNYFRDLEVKLDVVERIGNDFRDPYQAGLYILDEE